VPIASPITGVISVGEFDKTTDPDPVLVITPVPPSVTASGLDKVREVANASPKIGVNNVGESAKTLLPVPVLSTEIKLLNISVANALDAVSPEICKLVANASPSVGVMSVGEIASTTDPIPVLVVVPVPPLVIAKAFVKDKEVAVATPKIGVIKVGDVANTLLPVPVLATEIKFFSASVATDCEAVRLDIFKLIAVAEPSIGVTKVGDVDNTTEPVPVLVLTPVPPFATDNALVKVNDVAAASPNTGVIKVGELDKTFEPVPVLAIEIKFLDASVAIACEALRLESCKLVPVAAPSTGVTKVGDVDNTTEPNPVLVVVPVPPLATAKAVLRVNDVAAASPNTGVTNVGELDKTFEPVPVLATETKFFDASVAIDCEALRLESCKLVPVAAPSTGVTNVGVFERTTDPVPVLVVVPVPP
jgi:hypothetical protein